MSAIEQIAPSFHPKIWGSTGLSPWFPDPETKTGEVWFDADGRLPLIKFLFTSDKLSVQVHPDNSRATADGECGKTEMWHILRAAPGAQVAIGFNERVTESAVREAAISGSIVTMLNWIRVRPGDTLFVPAGTVHAIGAGLALCEIQQRSDVTYRLFDYGRLDNGQPRPLHLEEALAVLQLGTCPGRAALPVRCPFFHTERITVSDSAKLTALDRPSGVIVLSGEGQIGGEPMLPGQVWEIASAEEVELRGSGVLLRTFIP